MIAPPASAAFAESVTAEPAGNDWPLVGAVSDTVGAVLPVEAIVNATAVDTVLSAGLPLSTAVAVTEWLPAVRPVAVNAYGEVVSVFTRVPSRRNSTRATAPPGSAAVAARFTLVVPAANDWPAVGAVTDTVGAVLPVDAIVKDTAVDVVLNAGLPLSTAVAVTVCEPAARPVAENV